MLDPILHLIVRRRHTAAALALVLALSPVSSAAPAVIVPDAPRVQAQVALPAHCIAFSPYVAGYDPINGPHPGADLVDTLMRRVRATGFGCIMVYGVSSSFDAVYQAAERHGIQVIAIIWLDGEAATDQAAISAGIGRALAQPQTIVRLSCGSEVRTRRGAGVAAAAVSACLAQARAAGVAQPLGSIDSWWSWCNEAWPCQTWALAATVDWIGVNIYPWWENRYSGIFPCTPAEQAAAFTVARYQAMRTQYSAADVLLTEFGWPAGPQGYRETNERTGQQCGVAGAANQHLVIEQTLALLDAAGLHGVLFEAFREPWKEAAEGAVGGWWGVCSGEAPYTCPAAYGMRQRVFLPLAQRAHESSIAARVDARACK